MLGSLQEFIPNCFTPKPINSPRSINLSYHYNRNYSDRAQKDKIIDLSLDTNKYGDRIQTIKYSNQTIKSKYCESKTGKQGNNRKQIKIESSFSRVIPSNSQRNKQSDMEYVAQDKSVLLEKFKQYQNNNQNQKNEFLRIQQLQQNTEKLTEKKQNKSPFFKLNGKLKSSHHLLQALVRVEEQQMVNPNTFFQISFESMRNKYQTIKLQNKLRDKVQTNAQFKPIRVPLFINNKQLFRRNKDHSSDDIQKYMQKQPMSSLHLKIINKNTIKWAKTRSKSSESESKNSKYPKSKSIEIQKHEQVRKTIFKKIDGYINRTRPCRKNSLRKSSLLNSSHLFI